MRSVPYTGMAIRGERGPHEPRDGQRQEQRALMLEAIAGPEAAILSSTRRRSTIWPIPQSGASREAAAGRALEMISLCHHPSSGDGDCLRHGRRPAMWVRIVSGSQFGKNFAAHAIRTEFPVLDDAWMSI